VQRFPARYELKYRLNPSRARQLIRSLDGFLRVDANGEAGEAGEVCSSWLRPPALGNPGGAYHVRSLYFDTPGLDAYHGKLAGLQTRAKLRLRTYGFSGSEAFLELKRKEGPFILKSRIALPPTAPWREHGVVLLDWLRSELEGGTRPAWHPGAVEPALETMLFCPGLRPVALIAYERLAYAGEGPRNPRITFDTDVRGAGAAHILTRQALRPVLGGVVVLELKFTTAMPGFMAALVSGFALEADSISKYCHVLESIAPFFRNGPGAGVVQEGLGFPDTMLLYHAPVANSSRLSLAATTSLDPRNSP